MINCILFSRGHNGSGCWAFTEREGEDWCTFHWILDTDLKGWLPRRIVDTALTGVMTQLLHVLRQRVTVLQHTSAINTACRSSAPSDRSTSSVPDEDVLCVT